MNYIMMHKRSAIPCASWMTPVGLGGYWTEGMFEKDNKIEPNISHLNKFYCELTGIFHVWKYTSSEVVGISHYRRFLNLIPLKDGARGWFSAPATEPFFDLLSDDRQAERAMALLSDHDIILPMAIHSKSSVENDYISAHGSHEWMKFISLLDDKYGELNHGLKYAKKNYLCNMLIVRRSLFDEYCTCLFDVIDETFNECGIPEEVLQARYQPFRYPGYLAERFMSAFVNIKNLKVYEADVFALM